MSEQGSDALPEHVRVKQEAEVVSMKINPPSRTLERTAVNLVDKVTQAARNLTTPTSKDTPEQRYSPAPPPAPTEPDINALAGLTFQKDTKQPAKK